MLLLQSSVCLALVVATAQALQLSYCSSDNTGYSHSEGSSIYQSLGACYDQCSREDSFSWAIVQGNKCWCANDEPSGSSQVALNECDQNCPGYPDEACGNEDKSLFGYVAVQGSATTVLGPSGASTQMASSSAMASASTLVSPTTSSTAISSSPATSTTAVVAPQTNTTSSSTPVPYTGAADKTFGTWNLVTGTGILQVLLGCLFSLAL